MCSPVALAVLLLAACSPSSIIGPQTLPAGISDPGAMDSPRGATMAYRAARELFATAFSAYVVYTGSMTDELASADVGDAYSAVPVESIDRLIMPEGLPTPALDPGTTDTYDLLSKARGQSELAVQLFAAYAPDSIALEGYSYAINGYTELLLNEMYCSGIPLSTVDLTGNYTYRAGSSTSAVYNDAVALFDSATALAGDSATVLNLALVGKARALLGLGLFAEAAQVAAQVPTGFSYALTYTASGDSYTYTSSLGDIGGNSRTQASYTVGNREGINGLDYQSSGDPRTASTPGVTNTSGAQLYHVDKYAYNGRSPIVLANWIEARLIQAEAALQADTSDTSSSGTGWLGILNQLRETAISPALPDTSDPGSYAARVNLLFRERAFWLYLTGHRQGDMRRLIRQYGRTEDTVYPTGPYDAGLGSFGTDVTAPVPPAERQYNPLYRGCLNREP